jgi:hypothetical protein
VRYEVDYLRPVDAAQVLVGKSVKARLETSQVELVEDGPRDFLEAVVVRILCGRQTI